MSTPPRPAARWSRRLACATAMAVAAATLSALPAAPAAAAGAQHAAVVGDDPVDWSPHALDGTVYEILQVGDRVYMAGSFTQVRNANQSARLSRPRLVAFDATTGRIDTDFAPSVSGTVYALAASADGRSLYVGGAFTKVNGQTRRRVARVDAATGANWPGFVPPNISAVVNDLALVGDRLVIGGAFQNVAGTARPALAALDPVSGAVDPSVNLGFAGARVTTSGNTAPIKVEALDVAPDGSRMVVIGNFSTVAGQARHQVAVVNLGATATLSAWSTTRYQPQCANGTPSYVRDVEISGDGRWFVIVTAGFTYSGRLCDSAARWEFGTAAPNKQPTWVNYTGGDTLLSVAVTGAAVYVGGHQRWLDNRSCCSGPSTGSVTREGIGAINPTTGRALAWNPGKERGVGTADIHATPSGLWIGSDTSTTAGEFHGKIAFFPLLDAGPPPNTPPTAAFDASCDELACVFDATGSTDPDGTVASYAWNFGDGRTAGGRTPDHTYGASGTYQVRLTVTDDDGATATTQQQLAVGTAPSAQIGFRAGAGTNGNVTTARVAIPGAVRAGDGLLLILTSASTSATIGNPTGVTGWTSLGTIQASGGRSAAWRKVATGGDAGDQVSVTLSKRAKVDLRVLAYAGTAGGNFVGDVATNGEPANGTSHVSPRVDVPAAGRWVVTVWADKSSGTTSWTPPAGVTTRATSYGSGSGRIGALYADSGGPVPTGGYGGLTATTNTASRGLTWTIVLVPTS